MQQTPTETETPTPTPTPTETELVSPTPTETPTPTPTPESASGFTVTVKEVGSDVVWSGAGTLNLTNLTVENTTNMSPGYQANQAIWACGSSNSPSDFYGGAAFTIYPLAFDVFGAFVPPYSGEGSTFGIVPSLSPRAVVVPTGYVSNTYISGSTLYQNTTIASMGLSGGTYVYSWGIDSMTLIIGNG